MLRRLFTTAALALALLPALLGPAGAQSNDPSFRVVNNSSETIMEVYASPASDRNWGQDRLGADTIAPGANYIIRLPADGNCTYDVRVVYGNGQSEERRNLNTCNITDLAFTGATGGGQQQRQQARPGRGPTGNPSYNVVNQSGRTIQEVYSSPSSDQNWGPDRLGNDVVPPGGRYAIRLPEGECNYDLRFVFDGGQAQERRNVNLCDVTDYVVR